MYYSLSVNPTMIVALGYMTSTQAKATERPTKMWCDYSIIPPPTLWLSSATRQVTQYCESMHMTCTYLSDLPVAEPADTNV